MKCEKKRKKKKEEKTNVEWDALLQVSNSMESAWAGLIEWAKENALRKRAHTEKQKK